MDDKLPETDDLLPETDDLLPDCDAVQYSTDPQVISEHAFADLHLIAKQVSEIHAVLEEFRPLLGVLRPGGAGTEVQRAGIARTMRKRWGA